MNKFFTLIIFCLVSFYVKAQYSPETAVRIPVDGNYQLIFNNQAAPSGLNYGCANDTDDAMWFYFPVCDSMLACISLSVAGNTDTFDVVTYGPFTDTLNIMNQLMSSAPYHCFNNYTSSSSPFYGAGGNFAKGIYFMMVNKNSNTNSTPYINISNCGGPISRRSFIDSHCDICNEIVFMEKYLCTIDFDQTSMRNKFVWEKGDTSNISGYIFYRENSIFTVYDSLTFISVDSLSEFIDLTANPATRSWNYKMVAMDKCGNYPDSNARVQSFIKYNTIFLQQGMSSLGSISLSWSHGQASIPNLGTGPWIPSFFILHGTTMSNLTVIDSVPQMTNNYTHVNPVPGPNYYQIEMRKANGVTCTSSLLPTYAKSGSNIMGVAYTGLNDILPEMAFVIQPNPAREKISILLTGTAKSMQNFVSIYTMNGQSVKRVQLDNLQPEIAVSELSPGVYMVVLENEKGINRQKLVVY
jgi:hypothetical protein